MRYLLVFILSYSLFFACGGKDSEMEGEVRLKFALDTVVIHPGEEILFLNNNLSMSLLSEDRKFLYNFNQQEFALEKINLDKLVFEEKTFFSKEGPEGVGDYLMQILQVGGDTLLVRSYSQDNFMGWNAKKISRVDFKKIGDEGVGIKDSENIYSMVNAVGNSHVFYGIVSNWLEKDTYLMTFDLGKGISERVSLSFFDKNKAFEIMYNDGNSIFGLGTARYIQEAGGKLMLTSSVFNDIYVLDQLTGSLQQIAYDSELTANEKKGNYPNQVSDKKELEGIYRKISEEITFYPLFWDNDNELYYRFSDRLLFDGSLEVPENQFVPTPSDVMVYLTVFDKELNKLHESRVPDLNKRPARHFVKDGKIWVFENVEDEMGFVRLTVSS